MHKQSRTTKMVSCIIRTFNESRFIGKLLENLLNQRISQKPEIIIVDSGSTDETIKIVKKYPTILIQIEKRDFNYSTALNLGIEKSSNELIIILSGHSIPYDEFWIEKMISHFKDEKVAGVYCKQIPHSDADPYEIMRIQKMFNLPDTELHFSNAASCIRKSLWREHPFLLIPAAEDKEWAQWAIDKGYKIIYDPNSIVYHSHNEPCRMAAERLIQIEKANDLRISRHRNNLVTIKQSLGLFIRDLRKLPELQVNTYNKLALIRGCAARSFWYAFDFNKKK